jgi:hypothetical protein
MSYSFGGNYIKVKESDNIIALHVHFVTYYYYYY